MAAPSGSLLTALVASLTPSARAALASVRACAAAHAVSAFLVGGSVRDLLLGRPALDLDITIEGDAPAIAGQVAARCGLPPPVVHPAFGTATLRGAGFTLDLISARREHYTAPGALPSVTFAALRDDLARRDFSINAMALRLAGDRDDQLIDPFDGAADLRAGRLRVLHDESFRDDATRLLRAARYAARFRFRLEPRSASLAKRDRGYLATISPARIRHEFERTFAEVESVRALASIERMELADALLPSLSFGPAVRAAYRRLPARAALAQMADHSGEAAWLLPILRWDTPAITDYLDRFTLQRGVAVAARALPATRQALDHLARWRGTGLPGGAGAAPSARTATGAQPDRQRAPASAIVASLERLPLAALLAWSCAAPASARSRIAAEYLDRLRHVRPWLRSHELKALGVAEGPHFGAILRRLRAARLDEPWRSLDDERALVQDMLKQDEGA